MKRAVTISRIIVGVLFLFSGFIKAMDPLGLAYKMQEFFEVWAGEGHMVAVMNTLHDHAMLLATVMIVLEVASGTAILIGFQKKGTTWMLLILNIFFTFLTAYALFSGKVRECGCFGSCVPLSPLATFLKDVVLLALVIFIFFNREYIVAASKNYHRVTLMLVSVMLTAALESQAFEHLPIIDCLSYKAGNNILELRKVPADATFDQYTYTFTYKKGADQKEFTSDNLPDSSWQYVSRNQVLVAKGNGKLPLINDFSLTDAAGNDSTEVILAQNAKYYLFFIKSMSEETHLWTSGFNNFYQSVKIKGRKIYIVTGDRLDADSFFNIKNHLNLPIYDCDVTAIKTAARCDPTIFLMNGPVIQGKWAWLDKEEALGQ